MISTDFARQLLNGVSRSTLLDFDSFLRSEDSNFCAHDLFACWYFGDDEDPMIPTCLYVNCAFHYPFDFTTHEGRQDIERMMRQIRDLLDEGYGL